MMNHSTNHSSDHSRNNTKPFQLSESDRRSPLWLALMAHYTERLATLRARNDTPAAEAATADTRGRIAEVKALLDLGRAPFKVE